MYQHRRAQKRRSVTLVLEILENRVTPSVVTTNFTNIPGNNAYGVLVQHSYTPAMDFVTANGTSYETDLDPLVFTSGPSTSWLGEARAIGPDGQITNGPFGNYTYNFLANSPPGLSITVDSYNSYGNAFPATPPIPAVGGLIDMQTNLVPGTGQQIGWIQVYSTNTQGGITVGYTTSKLDNLNSLTTPLYPVQNQQGFFDYPARSNVTSPITWSAEVYLVSVMGNVITVYPDGVQWGWSVVQRTNPGYQAAAVTLTSSNNPSTTPR